MILWGRSWSLICVFYSSKQEVEFKDKQEFSGTEIRTSCLLGWKNTGRVPKGGFKVATSEALQG